MAKHNMGPQEGAPYYEFGDYFNKLILAWPSYTGIRFSPIEAESLLGINSTTISHYRCGRKQPTKEHCLSIAYFFHQKARDVFQKAKYGGQFDVGKLRADFNQLLTGILAQGNARPDEVTEYKAIMQTLRMVGRDVEWQELDASHPYKYLAEKALISNEGVYRRAKDYTYVVRMWQAANKQNKESWQRHTDELATLSSAS